MASIVSAGTTSATALNMSADTTGILQLASNNGTVALTINTSQNVGIGTSSPSCLLDVQKSAGANFVATFQNTTAATPYCVFIKDAVSSTAGYPLLAVTDSTGASTYLRVDSSNGNVGIGTAPSTTKLSILNTNATYSLTQNIFNASAGNLWIGQAPAATYFSVDNFAMAFCTSSNGGVAGTSVPTNERMRITAAGDVVVGSTGTVDSAKFQIFGAKALSSGIPQQQLNIADTSAIAAGVGGAVAFSALYSGTSYTTMGSVEGVRENATSGNYAGALVFRTRTNGSDNFERARITAAGELLIGKTVNTFATAGIVLNVDGNKYSTFTRNGGGLADFNRTGDDGNLIAFWQDGTQEGNITVTGTTVSYNGGHLSRYAQTTTPKDDSLVKGTVLSNLDEMSVYTKDGQPVANEQLNKVKVSDIEGDANVAGVFVSWSHDEEHNVDEINMAMTGDMIIRIAQGVTVVRGDLLMSAGDGTAKPQGDDIVRSKTVAKVTSNHITCTYADGSYCVPCVLMAC